MFKRREKGKRIRRGLLTVFGLVVILPATWFLFGRLEGEKPVVDLDQLPRSVPAVFDITGSVQDAKNGISKLYVGLRQNEKEIILADEMFPSLGFLGKGATLRAPVHFTVDAAKIGLSDGPATVRVSAWDYSWRNWLKGNQADFETEIVLDTRPPVLSVLTTQHNLTPGGSGLLIYRLSEPCPQNGVYVGQDFFPGYSGYFDDQTIYLAFFAVPFDHDGSAELYASAVDPAGNTARSGFYHHIRSRRFKASTLTISDHFLNLKIPEFQNTDGFPTEKSLGDQFVFVNTDLRKKNNRLILANGRKTEKSILWKDAFGRLPNSARQANFGDQRTYEYNGNKISHAVHMGIDLASVRQAEVPAANGGRVVFAGEAGIYGNLVCLDHGFGLISLYAHLSRITVGVEDLVPKGRIIGYTGTTGMAGGDHLHFGMFIDHVFVDPVEWWDATWITHNITGKLDMVGRMPQ